MSGGGNKNVENARKFLWDDDEDPSTLTPRTRPVASSSATGSRPFANRDYGVDQSVNLMAMGDQPVQQSRPSLRESIGGLFKSGAGSNEPTGPVRFDEYGDAAPSGESEEYIDDKRRRRLAPIWSQFCLMWNNLIDKCALACGRMSPRTWGILVCCAIGLTLLIIGIVGYEAVEGGSSRTHVIKSLIVDSGVSSTLTINNPNSPAALALEWIANEDPAQLEENHPLLLTRYGLAVLWYSFGEGDHWKNSEHWMTGKGFCSWYGVECIPIDNPDTASDEPFITQYEANAMMLGLKLSNNGIQGSLFSELSAFKGVLTLDLSGNEIKGTIPKDLHQVESVRYLYLQGNQLTGKVPGELGKLVTLHDVNLADNELGGSLPKELGKLTALRAIAVDRNSFSGKLPDLSACTRLTNLYLQENEFSGSFPSYLDKVKTLVDVRMSNNKFSGSLPSSFKALKDLEILRIDNNGFTGLIPNVFNSVERLGDLQMHENNFKGKIPETMGELGGLRTLYLDHNQLTGSIPAKFGLLGDVQKVYLDNNELSGAIPSVLGSLEDMTELRLNNNKFTGSIPSELGRCFRLINFHAEGNQLTGNIPSHLGRLSDLENLRLHSNSFDGAIMPPEVCALKDNEALSFIKVDCSPKVTCDCCDDCA